MTQQIVDIAILFADIAGSTRLYEVLGDTVARQKVSGCINSIVAIVNQYNGKLIKTIGDEAMCTFETADSAFQAACYMQDQMVEAAKTQLINADSQTHMPIAIRVGFHYGSAILEDKDVFGDAVNVAARLVALAKPEQIITTRQTCESLNPLLASSTRFLGKVGVKGRVEELEVFDVLWGESDDDLTQTASGPSQPVTLGGKLRLNCQGNPEIILSKDFPNITIGRGRNNNIIVDSQKASRLHAKIEYRHSKFILVDQSTNGTYVIPDGEKKIFIQHEEIILTKSGTIGLGEDIGLIHYVCES